MLKKMGLLVAAVGVLAAFALPATASAVTMKSEGETLPAGTEITMISTNITMPFYGGSAFVCSSLRMDGNTKGEGTETTGTTGWGGPSQCQAEPFKAPYTISSIEAEITLEAGGTGSMEFAFQYDAPALGFNECTLEGTVGVSYEAPSDAFSINGGPLVGSGGEGCPQGQEKIMGSFKLTKTTNNAPIVIQ